MTAATRDAANPRLLSTAMNALKRSRFPRRWCVVAGSALVVAALASCASPSAPTAASTHAPGRSLPLATYHGDDARTGYTINTSITASNASQLAQRWSTAVSVSLSDQPIVDGGVVYWGDWKGEMHATTVSGKALWSRFIGTAPKPKACPYKLATQGIVSTPTVGTIHGQNVVWVGGGAGQMLALNASTGAIVWSTLLGTPPEHEVWSSPLLYDGSIYIGVASWNDCPVVNGAFVRVDAATGAIQAVDPPRPEPKVPWAGNLVLCLGGPDHELGLRDHQQREPEVQPERDLPNTRTGGHRRAQCEDLGHRIGLGPPRVPAGRRLRLGRVSHAL